MSEDTAEQSAEIVLFDASKTEKVVSPHHASALQTLALVPSLLVDSNEKYEWSSKFLLSIKSTWEQIEEERKKITGPLMQAKQRVDALFRPALKALTDAEGIVKQRMLLWADRVEMQRTAEASTGFVVTLAPAEAEGVQIRKKWKWEIVNPEGVPREFCSPDDKKIRAYLDDGGLMAIPGVRFYEEGSIYQARKK